MKLKGFEFHLALFLPVYKFSILDIKLKYSAFMLFYLLLFHFKSKLENDDAFMYIYTFRKKNCKETLHLQQWQCILTLLHLHTIIIMQIILHSVDFARDEKKYSISQMFALLGTKVILTYFLRSQTMDSLF